MGTEFQNFINKIEELGFKVDNNIIETKHGKGKDMTGCFSIGILGFQERELTYVLDYHRWIASYSAEWIYRKANPRLEILDILPKTSKVNAQLIFKYV